MKTIRIISYLLCFVTLLLFELTPFNSYSQKQSPKQPKQTAKQTVKPGTNGDQTSKILGQNISIYA
jgi:hypothetical protein